MSLDLGPSLRTALIEATGIGDALDQWNGEPAVFTRRPVPADAPNRMIIVNPDSAIGDADGLTSPRPVVLRDIAVYGNQPDDYRIVEAIGYAIRELFHRNKWAITPEGYDVINIIARGPIPGPTDDDSTVARIVGLTISLRRQA